MFGGPIYDITGLVRFDQPNEVVVSIDKVRDTWFWQPQGQSRLWLALWPSHLNGYLARCPLESVPATELVAPFVRTMSLTADKAVLKVQYDIQNQGEPVKLEVAGTIKGKNFEGEQKSFRNLVTVQRGLNRYETELTIKNPKGVVAGKLRRPEPV